MPFRLPFSQRRYRHCPSDAGDPLPDAAEQNIDRLLAVAYPPVHASETLQQRVATLRPKELTPHDALEDKWATAGGGFRSLWMRAAVALAISAAVAIWISSARHPGTSPGKMVAVPSPQIPGPGFTMPPSPHRRQGLSLPDHSSDRAAGQASLQRASLHDQSKEPRMASASRLRLSVPRVSAQTKKE